MFDHEKLDVYKAAIVSMLIKMAQIADHSGTGTHAGTGTIRQLSQAVKNF